MDAVGSRRQIREPVVAVDIGAGRQVGGAIDGLQDAGAACQVRLAWIAYTVAVAVLKLLACDLTQLATVVRSSSDAGAAHQSDVSGVDRDLHPTGPACFADMVDSRDQIRKSVVAVGIGDRAQVS